MTVMSVELPDAIYQRLVELAQKEEVSVNQLVSSALFEKLSAYMTKDYLEERARRGTRERLLHALSKVPDNEADEEDKFQ
jgi:predicted transcriptional regulator